MIKELIDLSTHLDKRGLTKEANYLDMVIKRAAVDVSIGAESYNHLTADLDQVIASIETIYNTMPMNARFSTKVDGGESFNKFHMILAQAKERIIWAKTLLEAQSGPPMSDEERADISHRSENEESWQTDWSRPPTKD